MPKNESAKKDMQVAASSAGNYYFVYDVQPPDEIELSISSSDPVQTEEHLRKLFEEQNWIWDEQEPQSATDTKTLIVWVAKDEVANATQAILAMDESEQSEKLYLYSFSGPRCK